MVIGKEKAAGIGRYIVPHRSGSNVTFQRKEGRVDTWGFKVKRGLENRETSRDLSIIEKEFQFILKRSPSGNHHSL
jgi:hypothetical protein